MSTWLLYPRTTNPARRTLRLVYVVLFTSTVASVGCERSIENDSLNKELALRWIGEYRREPGGEPTDRYRPEWEKPLACFDPDNTFRFVDFPGKVLPMLAESNETWLNCEGQWQAASDEGGLIFDLTVTKVNGRATSLKLIWRPGNVAILTTMLNKDLGQFRRRT